MNYLYIRRALTLTFFIFFLLVTCNAQYSHKSSPKNPEKGLFGKSGGNTRKAKSNGSRSVLKATRKQEKNEKRLKKEYAQAIERSRKRTYDIQSPEVQARMKQDQKNTTIRDKEKKKNIKTNSKKAGKKYN